MKKFIYIAITVLFFIGCSDFNTSEGNLVIKSPSDLSHITRSIVDSSSDFVALDNDKLFKINLFVLIDGTLIGNFSMDPDTEKVMSVPSCMQPYIMLKVKIRMQRNIMYTFLMLREPVLF